MSPRLLALFLAGFLAVGVYWLLGLQPQQALAAGIGKIEGQVVNSTQGDVGVGGARVFLQIIQQTGQPTQKLTIADARGRFHFSGLADTPTVQYRLLTVYKGVMYTSEQASLNTGTFRQVKLSVYEVTHSDAGLRMAKYYLLLGEPDAASQQIMAIQVVTFLNLTTKTYIGELPAPPPPPLPGAAPLPPVRPPGPPNLLRFSLPPGANTLVPHTGLENAGIITVDRGFATDAAVPPGEHQIAFTYQFPYVPGSYSFTQTLPYRTGVFYLLAPLHLKVTAPGLTSQGPRKIDNKVYQLLSGNDLGAGVRVAIQLKDLPASPATTRQLSVRVLQVIIINLSVLCAIFVLLYALRGRAAFLGVIDTLGNLVLFRWGSIRLPGRNVGLGFPSDSAHAGRDNAGRGGKPALTPASTKPNSALEQDQRVHTDLHQQQLLQRIADLDDEFAAGAIREAEYHIERDAIKAELVEALAQLQDRKGGSEVRPSGQPGKAL